MARRKNLPEFSTPPDTGSGRQHWATSASNARMNKVRLGIIGMGNMGKFHADYLLNHKVQRGELIAVCSPSPAKLEPYRPLQIFDSGEKLIESGAVDAVI